MKKDYMRRIYIGTIGDMKNLQEHYAEMAEKGWMIDKIGVYLQTYRAEEPCKKLFFVDFLPQITAFDYPENEDAEEYRRICEEAGWTFAAANKQFHVFCSDAANPNPVPIHTDNSIHANIYLKACRKYELSMFLLSSAMMIFAFGVLTGAKALLSNLSLSLAMGFLCFYPGMIWMVCFSVSWYVKTKKSAKDGLPMPKVSRRLSKIRGSVFIAGFIGCLMCYIAGLILEITGGLSALLPLLMIFLMLLSVGAGLFIRRQVDTKRRTRKANIRLALSVTAALEVVLLGLTIFAIPNIPLFNTAELDNRPALTLNDVGVTNEPEISETRVNGSAAVPVNYTYFATAQGGNVSTRVYRAVGKGLASWLYGYCEDEFERESGGFSKGRHERLTLEEAALWGAEKGMTFNGADGDSIEMLLLKDKTVLRISADGENMDYDTVRYAVQKLWGEAGIGQTNL